MMRKTLWAHFMMQARADFVMMERSLQFGIACLQRGAGLHPKMLAALGSTAPHHDLTELPGTSLLVARFQSRPPGVCICDVAQTISVCWSRSATP